MFWIERAELHEWAWANVGDYFRSRHGAKSAAMLNSHSTREAVQETCCILVACTCCVYHPVNRFWFNVHQIVAINDPRAALVASNRTELDGCVDIDSRGTPFTNVIPIHRLPLLVGHSAQQNVIKIDIETLAIVVKPQLYTRVNEHTWRYFSFTSDSTLR
jgi:hypothetical protein